MGMRTTGTIPIIAIIAILYVSVFAAPVAAKTLKAKTYKKDITLQSGVLSGAGIGKTIIRGTVLVKGSGVLRNVTIRKGAIIVYSGVNFTMENVRIERAPGTAITTRGGGTLTVRNSAIVDARGKGMYIQRGKHIVITNTVVSGSREEGIDIRDQVSGIIANSTISGNGEGGIEVILGSPLTIKNSTIAHNRASGVAAQFYRFSSGAGVLTVRNTTIRNNAHFAVKCGAPSGGSVPAAWWTKHIRLEDNRFVANGGGIAPRCGSVRNYDLEAQRRAREEARRKAEEEARRKAEEEARRKAEEAARAQLATIQSQYTQTAKHARTNMEAVTQQLGWRSAIIGVSSASLDALYRDEEQLRSHVREAQNITGLSAADDIRRRHLAEAASLLADVVRDLREDASRTGLYRIVRASVLRMIY